MSMHYKSHTRDLKKKAYMRPDWRGMHGMHGSKKCKMHSDHPPDRAAPNSRPLYDTQEFVWRQSRGPLRSGDITSIA